MYHSAFRLSEEGGGQGVKRLSEKSEDFNVDDIVRSLENIWDVVKQSDGEGF